MTKVLNIQLSAFDAAFSSDFEVVRVSPQGKQKFAKFSIGVSKQLWSLNPITPALVEEEVKRLALSAIKQLAIKAKVASETSFSVSYNIVEILQTILPETAKLTKEEVEAWLKANYNNISIFLVSRGHSNDEGNKGIFAKKVAALHELLGKASSPNPGWKPVNLELILSLVKFLGKATVMPDGSDSPDVTIDAQPETTVKILTKVEKLAESPVNDVDAL